MRMKKIRLFVFIVFMTSVCVYMLPTEVNATGIVANGDCGNNLTWQLDNEGVLTIAGTGEMHEWELLSKNTPWYEYRSNILSVKIQDGVTTIGKTAFCDCINLISIEIPNSVVSINTWAFWGCRSLTELTLPANVTKLGSYLFTGCDNLQNINVSVDNLTFTSVEGVLYDENITTLIAWPCGRSNVDIPQTITTIGSESFYGCKNITKVDIPSNVITIQKSAFSGCSNLKRVTIAGNPTIANEVFQSCSSLENIDVLASSTKYSSIDGVLYNKDQTRLIKCPEAKISILIPDTVSEICSGAFYECKSLSSIFCLKV